MSKKNVIIIGMIKNLIEDKDAMFYLSNEQVNRLMKKSDKKKDRLEEQITKCRKNLEAKTNKKSKILTMFLDEKITEEEFDKQRADIDKEISSIQELLNDLESDINLEKIKNNTSMQVRKIASEGKTDTFNKELFDLLINKIVVGGKVLNENGKWVDEPKSLHFELNPYNLCTDLEKDIKDGMIHYKADKSIENKSSDDSCDEENSLCTLNSDNTCGDGCLTVLEE